MLRNGFPIQAASQKYSTILDICVISFTLLVKYTETILKNVHTLTTVCTLTKKEEME